MKKIKQKLIVFAILALGLMQTSQALTLQEIITGQQGMVLGASTLAVTATANGSADSSATSIATTGTLNVNTGDLLVAVVAHYNSPSRTVSSFSDGTNSFTLVPNSRYTDADGSVVEMWYKENASAKSAATFTANFSGASQYRRIMVWQISGAATSGALDQVSVPSSGSSTSQTCNNITTTQADEIILTGISEWFTHTYTAGSSFNNRFVNSGNDFIALDRIVASTGIYPNGTLATVSSASDNKYACVMASFKADLNGGTPPPADTTAPTTPTNLSASAVSSSAINLSWSASTDNTAVVGYKIYRNGSLLTSANSTLTTYSDSGLSASTSYSYTVAAYDAAGNNSAQSSSVSATTQAAPAQDTTAPTVPTNLSASAVSSSGINLSWTASTDAVGVTGYKIYRGGTQIGTSVSTSYSDTGLTASTLYSYTVAAYDAAGNNSSQSSSASATTQAQASGNCSATNIRCVGAGQEYATITAAAAATVAGDTVVVYPGTYNERVSLTRSGSSGSKITYQGFLPGSSCPATVNSDINSRGFRPAPAVKMQGFDVNANYITIQCFEITGTGNAAAEISPSKTNIDFFDNYVHDGPWVSINTTTNGGVASTRASYITALRNYVYKSQYGIILQCNNCTVQDNEFERMAGGSPGTDLDYSRIFGDNIVIRHNYMHGNNMADCTDGDCHIDCVQTWNIGQPDNQATNITIDRNVCFNSHEGIIARDTTHASPYSHNNWTITNNIFSDGPIGSTHPWCMVLEHIGNVKAYNNVCNAGGAGFYDGTNVTFKNNIYINGGYNPYGISASGWGNGVMDASGNNLLYESGRTYSGFTGDVLNKDPKFVNLASYNFRLQSGSPAIDAAANVGVLTDLDGSSRPQGAGYDIGAYEYASGGSTPTDTTAPTTPTNLSATAVSSSGINLSWTASTDAVGVTGYKIYRNGSLLTSTNSTATTYSDSGLSASTNYSYTVSAYDAAGNTSSQSSSVSATTQAPPLTPDITPPTVALTSPSSGTVTGSITVSATASDPSVGGAVTSGLSLLTITIDGTIYATSSSGSISKTLDTTTLTNASHSIVATAKDSAGNQATTNTITITVNNAPAAKYPRLITLTSLEGLSAIPNNQSITVTILSGSTVLETQTLTPNASKQYTISFLSSDPQLVDIRVKANNYLSAKLSSIDTTQNTASVSNISQLLAGDINNDNTINSLDYSSLNSNWLKSTSTGDMNGDGIVNSFDFAILKNNWNKSGN